jgi:hypothetical protein
MSKVEMLMGILVKDAGLGGGVVTSSPANPEVTGTSPAWVVYPNQGKGVCNVWFIW